MMKNVIPAQENRLVQGFYHCLRISPKAIKFWTSSQYMFSISSYVICQFIVFSGLNPNSFFFNIRNKWKIVSQQDKYNYPSDFKEHEKNQPT